MKEWLKVYQKLPSGYQVLVTNALEKIMKGDTEDLDIKDFGNGEFRCRIGKYRIIYQKLKNHTYIVKKLGTRGDIYKD